MIHISNTRMSVRRRPQYAHQERNIYCQAVFTPEFIGLNHEDVLVLVIIGNESSEAA